MDEIGIHAGRPLLGDIVDKARLMGEPTLLLRNGKPGALVVPVSWHPELLRAALASRDAEGLPSVTSEA